jgi:hypothetical protein
MASCLRMAKNQQLPSQKADIYWVLCSCLAAYIGQTGCHISSAISEHIRDTRLGHQWLAIAEHSIETKCGVGSDKSRSHSKYPQMFLHHRRSWENKHTGDIDLAAIYRLSKVWNDLFSPPPFNTPGLSPLASIQDRTLTNHALPPITLTKTYIYCCFLPHFGVIMWMLERTNQWR